LNSRQGQRYAAKPEVSNVAQTPSASESKFPRKEIRNMRNYLAAFGLLTAIVTLPAPVSAQSSTAVGVGAGAVTGAVVGGPIGAVVGGVAGGVIGHSVGHRHYRHYGYHHNGRHYSAFEARREEMNKK
jgi:outer membrane lipoprotein SlyB